MSTSGGTVMPLRCHFSPVEQNLPNCAAETRIEPPTNTENFDPKVLDENSVTFLLKYTRVCVVVYREAYPEYSVLDIKFAFNVSRLIALERER